MRPQELRSARLAKGWTQTKAAARLGVTQAYLNFLENGKRRLTPELARRATWVYGLSPEALPLPSDFAPGPAENRRLAKSLASLGYPGFSYLRTHTPKKNPAEVLLTALWQESLDGRVAEALPWVALQYAHADPWLVENARRFNQQNRLGFVVRLACQLAEKRSEGSRLATLSQLEHALDESRLVKEGVFYRPPRTESEREWLREHRTKDAAYWNLLTDMKPEHLQYAS
jgi:transcriptional regulator with XRE-family HTH domain